MPIQSGISPGSDYLKLSRTPLRFADGLYQELVPVMFSLDLNRGLHQACIIGRVSVQPLAIQFRLARSCKRASHAGRRPPMSAMLGTIQTEVLVISPARVVALAQV